MPNWCTNHIVIVGGTRELREVKAKLRGHDVAFGYGGLTEPHVILPSAFCFHNLVPVPIKVATAEYDPVGHKWCRENWGTKWQAGEVDLLTDSVSCLHYRFESAWCAPLPIFKALFAVFPSLTITIDYDEPGMELVGRLTLRECNVKHVTQTDDYWVGGSNE